MAAHVANFQCQPHAGRALDQRHRLGARGSPGPARARLEARLKIGRPPTMVDLVGVLPPSDICVRCSLYHAANGTTQVSHTDYAYDSAGRLTSLAHKKVDNSALQTAYGWTYDNQGRVSVFTDVDGTVTYAYDAASQVTGATGTGGNPSESYTYDKSGNRTNGSYTTGADNRLTSDGTYNYTYDNDGNRTRRTKISDSSYIDYTYDYRNRLTDEVYRNSGGTKLKAYQYVYDVNDRRIEKRLDANGDGTYESKERYIYDGDAIVLVYDQNNALVSRILQGPDTDQPLAEESGGGTIKWDLADEQGTIRDMGDNSSGLVANSHVIYNSFGVATGANAPGRYGYTGREWDSRSSLLMSV